MKPSTFQFSNRRATAFATAVILFLAGSAVAAFGADTEAAYTAEDCIECHQTGSEDSELHISVQEYEASAHAEESTCQDCHTGVVDDEHQSVEGSGAVDCGECHEQENQHGRNGPEEERPKCHDCHSRHNILTKDNPASAVHASQLPITCAGCHPEASGKKTYFTWFPAFRIASHNKADFGATYEKDNCLGCHQGGGAHGEQEEINEQACYKCHLAQGTADGIWGSIHPGANRQTQPAVFAAASIYQAAIVIGLILFAGRIVRNRRSSVRKSDAAE